MPSPISIQKFQPSPLRSQRISTPPTTSVNLTVDDLLALEDELKSLKARVEITRDKAGADITAAETVLRKIRELERERKGKAREKDPKHHKEKAKTPDIEEELVNSISGNALKRNPYPSKIKIDLKKKKRKRDVDSDGESKDSHKLAKSSPAPTNDLKKHLKAPVFSLQSRMTPSGYRIAEDFSEPSTSIIPIPTPHQQIPTPGPMHPSEVKEDFSKAKPPTQISITTFYSSIEPWLRPIREDELGLLEWDGDITEPFLVPPLGRHYSEVWDEEDRLLYGHNLSSQVPVPNSGPSTSARLQHNAAWDPTALTESDLTSDERGVGPIAERLVSALLQTKTNKATDATKDDGPSIKPQKQPVLPTVDIEERLKGELQMAGLVIEEAADYSTSEDQILADLRRCQRALRSQVLKNKARRSCLLEIAKDRLAYQEYLETRDALDRQIATLYSRLQKMDTSKSSPMKKRKKPGSAALMEEKEKDKPPICPASLGLGTDPSGHLVVSEQLMQLVRLRRQWVDMVGGTMIKKEEEDQGRLFGLHKTSVYSGIEEDIKALELAQDREGDG